MALVGGGDWDLREKYVFCVPGNCSVSYLSFVYGRSLWAEFNGGGNSLHWKANMLPLFSIRTLWLEILSPNRFSKVKAHIAKYQFIEISIDT